MKADFGIISDNVGGPAYLKWADIIKISDNPRYEVLSHSRTHACSSSGLYDGKRDQRSEKVESEIADSRQVISEKIGKSVKGLVWPCGNFNETAAKFAVRSGYTMLFLTDGKLNYVGKDHRDIHRTFVSGNCGMKEFIQTLSDGKFRDCPVPKAH